MDIIIIESTLGLIAVIFFRYKNPQKRLLNWISVFVLGIFGSKILLYMSNYWGQIIWAIAAIGLTIMYFLRFNDKQIKEIIDYLKWLGLTLLIVYPLTSYNFGIFEDKTLFFILSFMTIPLLGTIYIYDRWILKPEKMKKKYLIVLVSQSFLILGMFIFAFVQMTVAVKCRQIANVQKIEADRYRQMADQEHKRAMDIEKKYQELLK